MKDVSLEIVEFNKVPFPVSVAVEFGKLRFIKTEDLQAWNEDRTIRYGLIVQLNEGNGNWTDVDSLWDLEEDEVCRNEHLHDLFTMAMIRLSKGR